jgi:hypothetical protein
MSATDDSSSSKSYDRNELEILNRLETPIWVFDIEKKCMWWANKAGLELWNAPDLESLLSRNFVDDMSDATASRLADYLEKFKRGASLFEQASLCWILFLSCWILSATFCFFTHTYPRVSLISCIPRNFMVLLTVVDVLPQCQSSQNCQRSVIGDSCGARATGHAE